jgi:hypothetical protein
MTSHSHVFSNQAAVGNEPQNPRRLLIRGIGGQLGGLKLRPALDAFEAGGGKICGCDIIEEKALKSGFNQLEGYFNLSRDRDREALFDLGRRERFDLVYDATWPQAHLLNLVNWESISRYILVTKPFVSINQFNSLRALMELPGFECVLQKLMMHDHYANKPAMSAVFRYLPAIHRHYGKFSRMTIVISERRTVNAPQEVARHGALAEGMIPDLASHGVMIVQLLTPTNLVWEDDAGSRFRRLEREIEPTACVRAQMKNAAVAQDVDTACIAEYRVKERLALIRDDGATVGHPFTNEFFVLLVCGKGLSTSPDSGDLKIVEICLQGQQGRATGVIDLETNCLNEVIEEVLGVAIPSDEARAHRGINLPMLTLFNRWPEFQAGDRLRNELFQPPPLIWENMRLLAQTMELDRHGILPSYERSELIHHFVNTHIGPANGFRYFGTRGSGWPMKEPPLHLMRGRTVASPIP